jgi:predicted Rossmann fold nucleotide-binding protein DprA/Smf involved in DNA uptake
MANTASTARTGRHATLLDRITKAGLILSEYAPGIPPARHRLLLRSRLLSALTGGLLVVEAGLRSGARAAATATAIGRPVVALPGPVGPPWSDRCHQLIRDGVATLVTSAADVLAAIEPSTAGSGPVSSITPGSSSSCPRHRCLSTVVIDLCPSRSMTTVDGTLPLSCTPSRLHQAVAGQPERARRRCSRRLRCRGARLDPQFVNPLFHDIEIPV